VLNALFSKAGEAREGKRRTARRTADTNAVSVSVLFSWWCHYPANYKRNAVIAGSVAVGVALVIGAFVEQKTFVVTRDHEPSKAWKRKGKDIEEV